MKRTWQVTIQGDPPMEISVETLTDSLSQKEIFAEIKRLVKAVGIDPRLIIDWEMAEVKTH